MLHGWHFVNEAYTGETAHPPLEDFRRLTRDLYIAPGEIGFWQGAFRDPEEAAFAEARSAVEEPRRFGLDVLYGDHELGQRSITRFSMVPARRRPLDRDRLAALERRPPRPALSFEPTNQVHEVRSSGTFRRLLVLALPLLVALELLG